MHHACQEKDFWVAYHKSCFQPLGLPCSGSCNSTVPQTWAPGCLPLQASSSCAWHGVRCVMRRTQSRWLKRLKKVEKGWKRLKKVETPMKTLSFPIGMEIWGPKKNFFGHSMDAWLRMRRQATWDHGSWTEILAVQWCCAHFWWSSQWLMMIEPPAKLCVPQSGEFKTKSSKWLLLTSFIAPLLVTADSHRLLQSCVGRILSGWAGFLPRLPWRGPFFVQKCRNTISNSKCMVWF